MQRGTGVSTAQTLNLAALEVEAFAHVESARAHIGFNATVIVGCDVRLPGMSGIDWLPEIRTIDAQPLVVLITGHRHITMAMQAMRDGAHAGAGRGPTRAIRRRAQRGCGAVRPAAGCTA